MSSTSMMKAVLVESFGGVEKLSIGEHVRPTFNPQSDQLLVRVEATALNRADILQRLGKYPPPPGESEILGLEMSGIVEEVGEKSGSTWKKGDRVCALLGGGGYAQYCVIPSSVAIPIPPKLSFEEAAAIPEAFMTAYQALVWLGNLKENSRVFIHAGASGVGSAAIQIVKQFPGAQVITSAGSDDKLTLCKSLGADATVNYKDVPKFSAEVQKATNNKGVDILIDFVGASAWTENLASLGMDGTMVILGTLGGVNAPGFDMSAFLRKRIQIRGSTLRARSVEYKSKLAQEVANFLYDKLQNGQIKPVISDVFDIKDVREAHKLMEANKNAGKIVLKNVQAM